MPAAIDIIADYLRANNLDGLVNQDGECGCDLECLADCGCDFSSCDVGKKIPCPKIKDPNGEHHCDCDGQDDWHILAI